MRDDPDILSPIAERVLISLGHYRFLTVKQMLQIGVGSDKGHLHHVLTSLLQISTKNGKRQAKPKLIGELDFGVKVGKGRLSRLYYLTKRGSELLEAAHPDAPPAPYTGRVTQFSSDYEHRVRTVDFHIAMDAWAYQAGQSVTWCRRYFDWSPAAAGSRPFPSTRIKAEQGSIVPDALFMLDDRGGTERLFAFEMANGRDTGRVHNQIRAYADALRTDAINKAFSYGKRAVRILFVFEHERHLELVRERCAGDPALRRFIPHFYFKPFDGVTADTWKDDWQRISETVNFERLF